jgi:DNA-binding transcriptional regulator LsrR (DeoR family)
VADKKLSDERSDLLADVAEQYFLEGKTQAQIAKLVGVTRSMVSRMITEARQAGIVKIQIQRQLGFDRHLKDQLMRRFDLLDAFILNQYNIPSTKLKERLGFAGAFALKTYIKPTSILGLSWGTTVTAVVEAINVEEFFGTDSMTVVQLIGALGAQNREYDAHGLVSSLQKKFNCNAVYLNAPYIVESPEIAESFLATRNVADGIGVAKESDVALIGIGSTDISSSSFYLAGYVSEEDILRMVEAGVVGDVCGFQVDEFGNGVFEEFQSRVIGIGIKDYLRIPVRIGVAGGQSKILPLLGGLRAKYLNVLVTDAETATQLLELDKIK